MWVKNTRDQTSLYLLGPHHRRWGNLIVIYCWFYAFEVLYLYYYYMFINSEYIATSPVSTFSYFRRLDILGCDVIMQMRPEASRLCLFTSMSLVHVQHKIYKFTVHASTYRPCAINIPLNTLFCLLQKHPFDKKGLIPCDSIHLFIKTTLTHREKPFQHGSDISSDFPPKCTVNIMEASRGHLMPKIDILVKVYIWQ